MNALTYISGMSLLAAALATTVLSPVDSSEPRSGTRLGDMGRDTVLYTKEQADIVFAAQSGSVPTNMSQLVNDAGHVRAGRIADIAAEDPCVPVASRASDQRRTGDTGDSRWPTVIFGLKLNKGAIDEA